MITSTIGIRLPLLRYSTKPDPRCETPVLSLLAAGADVNLQRGRGPGVDYRPPTMVRSIVADSECFVYVPIIDLSLTNIYGLAGMNSYQLLLALT
jgi:hypothetical protein